LSAILWQEQVLFCHLYYGRNKFYFVSYIMTGRSFILSAILWQEEVLFCHLYYGRNKFYFVSYIMAGTSFILMRWWWCPLSARQTRLVNWIKKIFLAYWNNSPCVGRHVAPLGHYPNSEPTSLCSYSVMPKCLAEKQQIPILMSLTRTHNLRCWTGSSTLTITRPMPYHAYNQI
jgi:hypothetical protein